MAKACLKSGVWTGLVELMERPCEHSCLFYQQLISVFLNSELTAVCIMSPTMGGSTPRAMRSWLLHSKEAGWRGRNAVDTPHWLAFHSELYLNAKPALQIPCWMHIQIVKRVWFRILERFCFGNLACFHFTIHFTSVKWAHYNKMLVNDK